MAPTRDSQPGLEVVPETEAPQVVEGPTTVPKAWDSTSPSPSHPMASYQQPAHLSPHGAYGQQHQYPFPPQGPYVGSPPQPPHSLWAPSQVGTVGPSASEKFNPTTTILGIPARRFWLIVGPLLAVLVIGLAVGLGVGLGTSHSSSSKTTSTATATPTVSAISCPSDNNTLYTSTTDSKSFLILCNVDYNSGGGTTDIDKVVTSTAEDCANTCAANGACLGAGWGDYYGTTYCWMKSTLGTPQSASNWYFVVKQ